MYDYGQPQIPMTEDSELQSMYATSPTLLSSPNAPAKPREDFRTKMLRALAELYTPKPPSTPTGIPAPGQQAGTGGSVQSGAAGIGRLLGSLLR